MKADILTNPSMSQSREYFTQPTFQVSLTSIKSLEKFQSWQWDYLLVKLNCGIYSLPIFRTIHLLNSQLPSIEFPPIIKITKRVSGNFFFK